MATADRPDVTVSAKQLVFLTMIAIMAAVVAFLCGVQVGRGVAAPETGAAGPGVRVAPGRGAAAVAAAPPLPGSLDPARSRGDVLSYFERLRGDGPAPEALHVVDAGLSSVGAEAGSREPFAEAGRGMFVVQVMSVRGGAAAEDVKAGLEAKGYPVVVEPPRLGPGALHHVKVGPYADRAEAELASRRLRTEERFRPWVTQP